MLLAAFGLPGYVDLQGMNGLMNLHSALLPLISALTFIVAGLIAWEQALVMAVCATLGGSPGRITAAGPSAPICCASSSARTVRR